MTALDVIRQIQVNLGWLAREIDLNGHISPDLASRIAADAGKLTRLAAACGN